MRALTSLPASAGYFPSIYESRYEFGSTYVTTFVDGVGAGVVVHERSYVGLNNPDSFDPVQEPRSTAACTAFPAVCEPHGLTIDDRVRVAAARGPAPLSGRPRPTCPTPS